MESLFLFFYATNWLQKREAKFRKDVIEPRGRLLYQSLADPFRVVGKARHIKGSVAP